MDLEGFHLNRKFIKRLFILACFEALILVLSFISIHKITLLSYINISFYFSFFFLLSALLIYTIQTGFFDVVFKSFHFSLTRREEKKRFSEITPISELVSIDRKPLLLYGLLIGLFMIIALVFYYG